MLYSAVSRYGSSILWAGYDDNGEKFYRKETYQPYLFTKQSSSSSSSPYKSIHGDPLIRHDFDSMPAAREFVQTYKNSNVKIYGNLNYVFQFICDRFPKGINNVTKSDLNVCYFDIECLDPNEKYNAFPDPETAPVPIVSCAFHFSKSNRTVALGLKSVNNNSNSEVEYIQCSTEQELLSRICSLLDIEAPDILTGWNIRLFDVPYLVKRLEKYFGSDGPKKLSPFNRIVEKSIIVKGKENKAFDIVGLSQLDYLDIFKKFSMHTIGTLENYRLDTVAEVVLGENKTDYSEYDSLNELYQKDFNLFMTYNIQDTLLVKHIDDQINYIDIAMLIAYKMGTNFVDTLGTTAVWDTYIYREMLAENVIVPPAEGHQKTPIVGGYVKDPLRGLYQWITTYDLASLYPNIVVQYNISPDTIVDGIANPRANVESILNDGIGSEHDEYTMTANGAYFRKDKQGVLPRLVEGIYKERKRIKEEMLKAESELEVETDPDRIEKLKTVIAIKKNDQTSKKILLNSLVGCTGSPYFRFYEPRIAEGITMSGQLTIKWAEKHCNQYMNKIMKTVDSDYVVAIDTDSIMVNYDPMIEAIQPESPVDFLDMIGRQKFEPMFEKAYSVLSSRLNVYKERMVLEREKLCSAGFCAKKRYFMSVFDNEGVRYKEPKMIIKGIEAIKSSTPKPAKKTLREVFDVILSSRDESVLKGFMKSHEEHFLSLPIEQLSFPRSVNGLEKFSDPSTIYKKGTPLHVRAALLYNDQIKKNGLENRCQKINSGDKILYTYLKMPNPIQENVIGFIKNLPTEFGLDEYVDKETQFEKAVTNVLEGVVTNIGWKSLKVTDEGLSDFF